MTSFSDSRESPSRLSHQSCQFSIIHHRSFSAFPFLKYIFFTLFNPIYIFFYIFLRCIAEGTLAPRASGLKNAQASRTSVVVFLQIT